MSKKKKTIEELLEEVLVPEEKKLYDIPDNWIWLSLKNVLNSIQYGYTETSSLQAVGPKFLRITDIQNDKVDWSTVPYCKINDTEFEKYKLEHNDIVVARTGATTGKSYLIDIPPVSVFASYLIRLRCNDIMLPRFLWEFMKSPMYWNQITVVKKGSAQPGANAQILGNLSIPLPPIAEQKRIAERVENLLSKIDEAKQLIEEVKETFDLRRAAIWDKAFRGELTENWRLQNTNVTTANEWIEDINSLKIEFKTKYKDQLDLSILDTLYELPAGWKWVRLNDLLESSTYGTSAKTNDDVSGTPVIRMGNIVDGYLQLDDLKYLPNDHEDVLKYDLQTNDLLFNRTNSYELVGKTAVITEEISERFTFASYLIRVRLFYKDILASYVSHYINSHIGRRILLSMVTQQVGQANINSQKLASLPIPLPSKEEVVEIQKWLNTYRELENKQKEMLLLEENIAALKQSILSKAFHGELGTNDPSEESAIELLKEVLQEQVK